MPRVKIDPSKLPGKLPIPDLAIRRAYEGKVLVMSTSPMCQRWMLAPGSYRL